MTEEEKKAAAAAAAAAAEEEMSAEEEAFLLSINEDEVATLPPEDIARLATLSKKFKTTIHQKNHWKEKASSTEKPPANTPPAETPKAPQASSTSTDDDRAAKIEFRQDHPELTKEDIAEIFALAKARGITPDKALETPIVKAMLKDKASTNEVDDATPKPNARVAKTPKEPDISTMDAKQFREHRDKLLRERRR